MYSNLHLIYSKQLLEVEGSGQLSKFMKYVTQVDKQFLKWAYQRPFKRTLSIKAFIFIGDGPFWMIVVLIAALIGQFLDVVSFEQLANLLMFGLIISNLIFVQLKTRVTRKRPYANMGLQEDLNLKIENRDPGHGSKELESFPSGHVLWTTLCVSLICFQYGLIAVLLFAWMIPAMMFLRLYLGVHYPTDTLAGLVLGGINVAITLLIAPGLLEFIDALKEYSGFIYGYWVFICIFVMIGFKSWLKRV